MNISKAVMTTDGDTVKITVPFAKVNKETRTVSGFATLDNVDEQRDQVTAAASKSAFSRFRGNLREMHAPIAVGKVLSFEEQDYYDPKTERMYKGLWVNAFVSKGAQDTWEKVLDGTLTGFSIGGKVLDQESTFDKAIGQQVNIVKDYELLELSLVDNPANQLANVFTITKMKDGTSTIEGIAVDVKLENIFWCATDDFALTSSQDTHSCNQCDTMMKNIGWVESSATDKIVKVRSSVEAARSTKTSNTNITINVNGSVDAKAITKQVRDAIINKTLKGGVDVADNTKETEVVVTESAADNEEVVSTTDEAPAEETTAVEVEEVTTVDVDVNIAELFKNFADELKGVMLSSKEESATAVNSVKEELAEVAKSLGEKISGLETKFGALESGVELVVKRVDSVESDTSIKKSLDLGRSEDKVEKRKSVWGGTFLDTNEITE